MTRMMATTSRLSAALHNDPRARLSPEDKRLLASFGSLRCRAGARLDLSRACATVGTRRDIPAATVLDAVLATLGEALGRSPRFYRPTVRALSFDESWLLRLISALRRDDEDSAIFLLHSLIPHGVRRSVVHLVGRVAADAEALTAPALGVQAQLIV